MDGAQASNSNARSVAGSGPTLVASIGMTQKRSRDRTSSLDAMRDEIQNQVDDLPNYATKLRENEYQSLDPSEIVFTGSGDSFASSLFAYYLSGELAHAADPYELQHSPDFIQNKILFITSVSGKTSANVQLARRARKLARKRVAVTGNPRSPLARECDDVIQLAYSTRGILTSGTVSFTTSLLALASTVKRLPALGNLDKMNARAARWARDVKTVPDKRFLFVGARIGYSLAAYGAFKIHEVLGESADYEHTEQLGHSRLFGVDKKENIVCFATRGDSKTLDVFKALRRNGFHAHLLACDASDPLVAGLEAAFSFQHLALNLARRSGLRECAFLSDRSRLALSSRLIY